MTRIEKDFQGLFVDKENLAREIAKEIEGFVRIDTKDCTPIFPFSLDELTMLEHILIELGISYICFVSGVNEESSMSREDLRKRCKLSTHALRARLSDLRKRRFVESSSDGEEITTTGLIEFRDLLGRLKKEDKSSSG